MRIRTTLYISANSIDKKVIDQSLQLIPDQFSDKWMRTAPGKVAEGDLENQLLYWCRLFKFRKDEKNKLQKLGYKFTIECLVDTGAGEVDVYLSAGVLEEFSRLRFDLSIITTP